MDTVRDYIAPALGELRHLYAGRPDDINDRDDADAVLEGLSDRAEDYARDLLESYEYLLENHTHYVEALSDEYLLAPPMGPDGETVEPFYPPRAPSLVEDEINRVAHLRRELDSYMKYLVVFAHRYALEDFSQSELSRLTGATRVTISRWLADEGLARDVAAVVRANAREAIKDQKPADIKDKATASAMGVLRWYATVSEGESADGEKESSPTHRT